MRQPPPAAAPARPAIATDLGPVVLLASIAALYFARDILIPLAFAITLTFLLTPVVAFLQRLRTGRVVAVLLTVAASIVVACGVGWVIANQLVDVANQLPLYGQNIRAKIEAFHLPAQGQLGRATASLQEIGRELTGQPAPSVAPPAKSLHHARPAPPISTGPLPIPMVQLETSTWMDVRDWGTPLVAPMARAGMVVIFTIFMLFKSEDLRNRLVRLVGLGQVNLTTQALADASGRVSRYLLMLFLVNAGFGTLFGLGLYCIGVPNAALWGVLAALMRIIPYVGTMFAAMLPIALSLAVFGDWLRPLLVVLLAAGLELTIANFVEPWLYGAHVGISSLALLVTSVFWAVLWGPAGLILATPLTVCLVVLGRYVPQLSFLHILLGDEPVLAPEAQIYQRLLAMDQLEARTVIDQFLKRRPLIELYDSLLIPALSMAEHDRHRGAIHAAREEFLFLSINELIVEFSAYLAPGDVPLDAPAETEGAERPQNRILLLPAHDRADELTAAMLAQVLEQKGFTTLSFPGTGPSPNELLALMDARLSDVVCISALPPYAFAPAQNLCKQIRERFPKVKVMVCVWGFTGDTQKAKSRFERTQPDRLSTSLAEAVEHVHELVGPVPEQQVVVA